VELLAALRAEGVRCTQLEAAQALDGADTAEPGFVLVDSLYLDAVPALRARWPSAPLMVLLHYLPSLVERGRVQSRDELSAAERRALELGDGFLVTSAFMAQTLQALGVGRIVLSVEPGVAPLPARGAEHGELRVLMLCGVTEGKGVKPLLAELATQLQASDRFELAICGRIDLEPAYAAACSELLRAAPGLAQRVRLLGPCPHAQAQQLLVDAQLLLSASRMESYGMALAEARAAGVPIVAREGGNAAHHVDAGAGGALLATEAAVARELLLLVRDPERLAARRELARRAVRTRSWQQAARELLSQLQAHHSALEAPNDE
jgi:glycosyltransferase involved in cell wall biosynthesis